MKEVLTLKEVSERRRLKRAARCQRIRERELPDLLERFSRLEEELHPSPEQLHQIVVDELVAWAKSFRAYLTGSPPEQTATEEKKKSRRPRGRSRAIQ